MKTILVALLVLVSGKAMADTKVKLEMRLHLAGMETGPAVGANAYVTRALTDKVGLAAWIQVEEKWSEAYVGLTYSPRPWVEIGISAGLEQAAQPWRVAGSVWLGYGRFSSLTIVENGGSGWWFQSAVAIKATEWLKLGVMIKRFEGLGPKVEVNLTPNLVVWVAYLPYDPESSGAVNFTRTLTAASYSF